MEPEFSFILSILGLPLSSLSRRRRDVIWASFYLPTLLQHILCIKLFSPFGIRSHFLVTVSWRIFNLQSCLCNCTALQPDLIITTELQQQQRCGPKFKPLSQGEVITKMEKLYVETPLIESVPLSKVSELKVYLKLENAQPSGSFKLRGLSNHCIQVSGNDRGKMVATCGCDGSKSTRTKAKTKRAQLIVIKELATQEWNAMIAIGMQKMAVEEQVFRVRNLLTLPQPDFKQ